MIRMKTVKDKNDEDVNEMITEEKKKETENCQGQE